LRAIHPELAGYALLLVAIISFVLGFLGKGHRLDIWIECKDLKRKVNRDLIETLVAKAKRVKHAKARDWDPDKLWFATGPAGFNDDALEVARDHAVVCLQWNGDKWLRRD
jgi:hypothetical protein